MKHLDIPNLGYRNIKTSLAVLICLLLMPKSLNAPIASIISMQSTVEDSVEIGLNRLIGTFLGGLLGAILLIFIITFNLHSFSIIIASLGVSLIIYICILIKKPAACTIASIVVLIILIDPDITNPISYAFRRTFETVAGVIIAIVINALINPPKDKKCE
ncbi:MAG: FUSC family protein [Clostridiales bacterium]|nr:FUSC family protein [Clostridiales bacterium]